MAFETVIDPVTKERTYKWVDQEKSRIEQVLDQKRTDTANRKPPTFQEFKEDLTGVAKAVPRMFVNAGINAVQEGSDTIRDIGGYFGIGEGTTFAEPDKPILGMGGWKPETLESSGVVEDIGTGILQFGLEWVMLSKALRLANWGLKATPLAKPLTKLSTKGKRLEAGILRTVGKSPIAPKTLKGVTKFGIKAAATTSPRAAFIDFAGFDQYEGRLYDLAANSNTWFNNVKHIPLVNQLATNPEDEGLRGRFKNALEGSFIDLGLGTILSARSASKVVEARVELDNFLRTPKTLKNGKPNPQWIDRRNKLIETSNKLQNIPEIKKAISDSRVSARQAKFNQPIDIVKERRVKVEGDINSIKQQIDELGPEPPKPGKGQSRTKEGKWTPAYRRWDKWNRTNKSLQARLTELTTQVDEAPISPTARELPEESLDSLKVTDTEGMRVDDKNWYDQEGRPIAAADASDEELYRNAFMQRAKDLADGIESGDLPYFYGPEGKIDEAIAAQVIEGRSISEIIENLKTNIPKATVPIGEAKGITLSNYRGAEKIIKRLKDQVGKQGFTRSQREGVEEFIDTIGRHMFDDVAFSFNSKIGAAGQFSFNKKLVEVRSQIIKTGRFEETMIHELWHSLSRNLPASDLKRYFKEWKNARKKYEASMKKKFKFYDEDGTPSGMKKMKKMMKEAQTKADAELKATGEISEETIKEIQDIGNHSLAYTEFTDFLSGKAYTDKNYRFADVDEYFAEMLTDHFMLNYTPVDFAPKGTFRRLIQEIGIFFKELWIEIHARLGPHNTEKIFNDYLKGRNKKQLRKYSLETYFDPDRADQVTEGFLDIGIQINEAAQEFNVISGPAFDEIRSRLGFTKQRVNFEPDELADLYDFISSFEDPTYDKLLRKIDAYIYPEKGAKKAPYPINEKDGERIDDLLDILEEESPKTYREWEWLRDEPGERKIRKDAEDQARFEEESRLFEEEQARLDEDQARQETGDDPRDFYEKQAEIYDQEQSLQSPESAGGKVPEGRAEEVSEDLLETIEKIENGEADLLDSPIMWDIGDELAQDVTTLRSGLAPGGKGNRYYGKASEQGSHFEQVLSVISKHVDRITATGMPSLSPQKIVRELGQMFERQGINLNKLLHDKNIVEATEMFANNAENITNLLKIRFGLNFACEQSHKWAMLVNQAANNPSIDKAKAMFEMIRNLELSLQFAKVYQTWTRSAGQLLNAAQAEIITDGLTETTKRQDLNFNQVTAISDAAKVPAQTILSNIPDDVLTAMRTGEWTPQTEGFMDQIIGLALDSKYEHGVKALQDYIGINIQSGGKNPKNIDTYERITKGLVTLRNNNLLSMARTWALQLSSLGRTAIEPLTMSMTAGVKGDFHHARLALMQYEYIRQTFYGSLKLGSHAWRLGQSLYDPKIRTSGLAVDQLADMNAVNGYAKDRAYQLADPHPAYDLNTAPFHREGKRNPGLNAANILWRLGTWNIRGQSALDTLTKSISGNALAMITGIDQGITKGQSLGLKGIELDNYAREYAEGRLQFYTFDAVINGETIADAIMKDESAIQIGRILTYTDEIRARLPKRSYQHGEALARAKGITDESKIAEFADLYMKGEHLEGLQKAYNKFLRKGDKLIQGKDVDVDVLPDPGDLTPVLTSSWSQLPQAWGKMQSSRHGWIASFIHPFNRSPHNLMRDWLKRTPFAPTVDTFYRDLFQENYFIRNRWQFELTTGTAAAGLFATTILNNDDFPIEFTGFGPNSPDLRKVWTDNEIPPLSWRWRGKDADGLPVYGNWHSYKAYETATSFIAGLADYKMLFNDMSEDQKDECIGSLCVSTTAQVMLGRLNATYYQGIVEFVDAITPGSFRSFLPGSRELEPSERSKLARYIQRLFVSFIPESNRLREISRAIDPYKREIDSGVKPIEAFNEADKGLVKMKDLNGLTVYLKKEDLEKKDPINKTLEWIASYSRQQIDEIKNTIPLFSDSLPKRTNWITGLEIRNKGFLGSHQLPLDDAPWLARLSSAYFGTIKGAVSEYGLGAISQDFDPRLDFQKVQKIGTYEYKAAIVNDELIKLSRSGSVFAPPRPTDFGIKDVRLSPPAFRQYKEYIYSLPHSGYGGMTLTEALYQKINSKSYKKLDYIIHPDSSNRQDIEGADPLQGFVREDEILEIINDYTTQARKEFINNPNNKYRMEILIPMYRLEEAESQLLELKRSGTLINQSDSMGTSTQEFTAQLNQ